MPSIAGTLGAAPGVRRSRCDSAICVFFCRPVLNLNILSLFSVASSELANVWESQVELAGSVVGGGSDRSILKTLSCYAAPGPRQKPPKRKKRGRWQ
jgi:hypothetical protein